jgi:hypothetical protein
VLHTADVNHTFEQGIEICQIARDGLALANDLARQLNPPITLAQLEIPDGEEPEIDDDLGSYVEDMAIRLMLGLEETTAHDGLVVFAQRFVTDMRSYPVPWCILAANTTRLIDQFEDRSADVDEEDCLYLYVGDRLLQLWVDTPMPGDRLRGHRRYAVLEVVGDEAQPPSRESAPIEYEHRLSTDNSIELAQFLQSIRDPGFPQAHLGPKASLAWPRDRVVSLGLGPPNQTTWDARRNSVTLQWFNQPISGRKLSIRVFAFDPADRKKDTDTRFSIWSADMGRLPDRNVEDEVWLNTSDALVKKVEELLSKK